MIKPFVLLNATLLIHRLGGPPSPLEKAKESDKSKFECCGKYFEGIGKMFSDTLLQFLGNCDTMRC
jgi:hypothetical protein